MTEHADMIPPLIEEWPFPLLLIEPQTEEIIWANQAFQEWLGKSLRHLKDKRPWDIFSVDDDVSRIISKCANDAAPFTMRDCPITRGEQEEEYAHFTAYPTASGIGLSIWLAGPQPQSAKVGGQLVSGMGRLIAHELKNPLAGIKGAAQLLRDDVASEEGQSLIDLIGSEIDRIRRLADRMETLGDQDPENSDRVNIHEILRRARRVIQSANPSLVFTERYDPSLPHAKGDADTLMQAMLNLIKNAAEAVSTSEEPSEIILETRFRSGVTARGSSAHEAQHLPIEIRIIDNGPGIADHVTDQIFQPFVSTKPEGQGLGLALVSKVAAAHGGLVEVKSRPGKTKFSLLLPTPNEDIS
ncbi:two-component system sensor histidine kinase NtrB [Hellea balneolensis]|uniref:two-component system sensor histidine kinase NtrB n=1 Tax=Hellea balneolensis TaxID=287478 RepID=UPI000414AFC0|nr:ATP-binding protein [Hellea balneolensis]